MREGEEAELQLRESFRRLYEGCYYIDKFVSEMQL